MIKSDNMSYKNTTVSIDEDKLDLCKKRGIKLKTVLNDALDIVLEIDNFSENSSLEIEKQNLLNELENLEKQYQEYSNRYENNVKSLKQRIELIDGLIIKSKVEYKENKQKEDYQEIINILDKSLGDVSSNPEAIQLIQKYVLKYNIPDDDTFYEKINTDYIKHIQEQSN